MAHSSITVTVYRGSNEIGGNCVELATAKSRLIVDAGMPLSEMADSGTFKRRKADRDYLIYCGAILPIPGLLAPGPKIDGILLSQAHGDHFGLIEYTLPDIPIYLSGGASKMLMSGALFAGQSELLRSRRKVLVPGKPRRMGDFNVTAFLTDHSSYGSAAFLIEAGGKRIVYTGDLRLHDREPGMAQDLLKAIHQSPLDLLILEGTSLSRGKEPKRGEKDVEEQLVQSLKQTRGLALAMFSPQNVDRLATCYRAAINSGRTLVLDPYAAFILHLVKGECAVPDPFQSKHIRIFLAESLLRSVAGPRLQALIPRMRKANISRAEILAAPGNFLMIFREWMYERIFEMDMPPGSRFVDSYWARSTDTQPRLEALRARLEESGCAFDLVHGSGHIYYQDMIDFIKLAKPRKLMPIHTSGAHALTKNFSSLIEAGSTIEI